MSLFWRWKMNQTDWEVMIVTFGVSLFAGILCIGTI